MPFSPEDFVACPSWEKLNKCNKENLRELARRYEVELPQSALKPELKQALAKKLVEKGVLPARDAAGGDSGDAAGAKPESESAENLRLTLQIKKEETRQKELDVEILRLSIEKLKLERGSPATPPASSAGTQK